MVRDARPQASHHLPRGRGARLVQRRGRRPGLHPAGRLAAHQPARDRPRRARARAQRARRRRSRPRARCSSATPPRCWTPRGAPRRPCATPPASAARRCAWARSRPPPPGCCPPPRASCARAGPTPSWPCRCSRRTPRWTRCSPGASTSPRSCSRRCSPSTPRPGVEYIPIADDEMRVAVAADHPLATTASVTLEELLRRAVADHRGRRHVRGLQRRAERLPRRRL